MYEYYNPELQRTFRRGEVYYVVAEDSVFGSRMGRPAVLVSSERELDSNSNSLSVVFCTTSPKAGKYACNVLLPSSPRNPSYAACNQVSTVLREKIGNKQFTLTAAEMEAVDAAIAEGLGLFPKKESEDSESVLESQRIEIEMWKRLYEKTLDQLVEMKFNSDVLSRNRPERHENKDEGFDRVEINSCNLTDLQEVGFSANTARKIVFHRPYNSVEDLKRTPGITPMEYQVAEQVLYCVPVEKPKKEEPKPEELEKINVNTATAKELAEALGMSLAVAYSITGTRNREGNYRSLEDLLRATKFTESHLAKYRSMLTV